MADTETADDTFNADGDNRTEQNAQADTVLSDRDYVRHVARCSICQRAA